MFYGDDILRSEFKTMASRLPNTYIDPKGTWFNKSMMIRTSIGNTWFFEATTPVKIIDAPNNLQGDKICGSPITSRIHRLIY